MNLRHLAVLGTLLLPALGLAQPPVKPRLDAHGFPLPEGAFARIGNLHYVQPHEIQGVAISPDGKSVATVGDWLQSMDWYDPYARAVTVFDGATGRSKHSFSSSRSISGIRFSPSSKLLAIRHHDGATVLDLATGKHESWPPQDAREGESSHPIHVGFVNDEQSVVTCGGVPGGRSEARIRVWDRKTGKLQRDWSSEDGKVAALKLATGDDKDSQRLCACLSPSGQWMAWHVVKSRKVLKSGQTKTVYDIHVFNTWTGERKGVLRDVDGGISQFGLLDEGETAHLTERFEKAVEVRDENLVHKSSQVFIAMDVKTGRERYRIHGSVYVLALPGDGKSFWAYTGENDRGVIRRDLATGKHLSGMLTCYRYNRGGFAAAADGKRTVVAAHARWQWADIDLKPLQPLTELQLTRTGGVWESNRRLRVYGPDKTRKIWDVVDGKFVETIKADKWPVEGIYTAISPQRKLAVVRDQNKVMILDLKRTAPAIPLQLKHFEPYRLRNPLELSADDRRILINNTEEFFDDRDNGLMVSWYDSKTGRALGYYRVSDKEIFPHEYHGTSHWFADDGSAFAYLTRDHQLAVVDCATGKVRLTIGQRRPFKGLILQDPAWRYEIEPGRQFVSGLGRLPSVNGEPGLANMAFEHVVYDKATGAVLRRFVMPPGPRGGPYSHDHRLFLRRTSLDGDLTVFETATARPRGVIRTGVGAVGVPRLKLSPDGKTLAVGCVDTTTLLFNLDRPFSDKPIPPAPKSAKEAAALWDKLGDADPREAEPAIWALARAPALALEIAKERLPSATRFPDAKQQKIWIEQLNSANFNTRDEATRNLGRVGEPALKALREALEKTGNLEHRRRIEMLIAPIEQPLQADDVGAMKPCLLGLRALELLERIGSYEARRLIESVAANTGAGVLGHEAILILARWARTR